MNRNLSGLYFRVLREGNYVPVCFEDMTSHEQMEILNNMDTEKIKQLTMHLAYVIKDIGNRYDIIAY